ncbi:MAG: molybdopterin-guanine dinucleotide biosynthesis protein B [Rhodospirillales bacterium 70-18]|nr:molybdopterin-guanine dinucleotide biosynthesis protein B [Rhodospirillales bacterium]OJY70279.1 MAG: molybdopterin-guanine dinucleotide biosynthesis protein B [Rhodospirillales bacterium 70-18]
MRLLGLTGWSGSGKTVLLTALLPLFAARGLAVSTVKHAHHGFDLDQPGKDSWRHREAGAREVLIGSGRRWALLHELRDEAEPGLPDLLARLSPVDLVLVEGFKANPHPKIEVFRPVLGRPPLWSERADIVAVACDAPPEQPCDRPLLPLNDPAAVAAWACRHLDLPAAAQHEA